MVDINRLEHTPDYAFLSGNPKLEETSHRIAASDLNGPNKKQELKRLKEHLQDYQLTDVENSLAKNMSNSTKDEDWKKMRRKTNKYHGYQPVKEGNYLAFETNIGGSPPQTRTVTGPLQVVSYDEQTGMYTVNDEHNIEHKVDEDTLYPNGI